jgi:E3 ubiquitin-protein ligase RBBP6
VARLLFVSRVEFFSMAIHFKFRSAVEYDSIDIDGPFISIGSLKEKIVEHKNLGRATDFDLLITNAQTAEGNFPGFS